MSTDTRSTLGAMSAHTIAGAWDRLTQQIAADEREIACPTGFADLELVAHRLGYTRRRLDTLRREIATRAPLEADVADVAARLGVEVDR